MKKTIILNLIFLFLLTSCSLKKFTVNDGITVKLPNNVKHVSGEVPGNRPSFNTFDLLYVIDNITVAITKSKNQSDSLRKIFKRDSLKIRTREDSLSNNLRQRVKQDAAKMAFIVTANGAEVKSDKILLYLEFKNISNDNIKILEPFNEDMPAFFRIIIYCETGDITVKEHSSIMPYNTGLLDLPAFYKYKYTEIPKGKSYKHTINLTEIIKSTYDNLLLPKGIYRVKMAYSNVKGNGCVFGTFKSEDVKFTVIE